MLKKILGIAAIAALLCGCDATVTVSTTDSGAPVGKAIASVVDSSGKNTIAQGATGVNGKLKVVVPYGDYKIKAERSGYIVAEGFIHVDLFSGLFGAKADIPLVKQPATAAAIQI